MTKSFWGRPKDFPDTEPLSTLPRVPPGEEAAYAETAPQGLSALPPPEPAGLSLAPLELSLYEVMAFAHKDNRVCPQPTRWVEFFRALKDAAGAEALPAEPLVGSAWAATPPLAKRMSFDQQLQWADRHGCLGRAFELLKSLRDSDWYTA